ncbi:hypothetical protein AGLY_014231 [Aphis glycines]|uniref:Endonuclease/exonuclease/phosphatase domain-containing protein n=1 Tax=Aphis glycines TaxID=307491 RepID=A0A6G0T554_APHGL|nr:hypothetical protein AGLY_014231 [Aphis glycines]
MRNDLPMKSWVNECGVLNLNDSTQNGSHWVAWKKMKNKKIHFDSFGINPPPKELVNYLGKHNLWYTDRKFQDYNDPPICGHLPFPSAELGNLVQSLSFTHIIGADFNAKHQTWSRSTNTRGRTLQNFISLNHLKVIASLSPTYWPSHINRHPDTLDFFITNLPNRFSTEIINLNDPASDHTPVLLLIGAHPSLKKSRPTINPGTTNWNKFKDTISNKTTLNIKLKSITDVDQAIAKLTDDIQKAALDSSTQNPPYSQTLNLSPELRRLIAEKRRARSKWQHTHYPADKIKYNFLSNKLKSLLKTHKTNLYKSHIQNLSFSNGSIWRKTKSILRIKDSPPPIRRPDNSLAFSDKEKADILAEELSGVFKPHLIPTPALHIFHIYRQLRPFEKIARLTTTTRAIMDDQLTRKANLFRLGYHPLTKIPVISMRLTAKDRFQELKELMRHEKSNNYQTGDSEDEQFSVVPITSAAVTSNGTAGKKRPGYETLMSRPRHFSQGHYMNVKPNGQEIDDTVTITPQAIIFIFYFLYCNIDFQSFNARLLNKGDEKNPLLCLHLFADH